MIKQWADVQHLDLILTSGGTGFGIRDNTPETVKPLLHREAPGVAQALINEGTLRHSSKLLCEIYLLVLGTTYIAHSTLHLSLSMSLQVLSIPLSLPSPDQ